MRLVAAVSFAVVSVSAQEPGGAQEKVDFTRQVAPLLVSRCIECHGPKEQKGDLRLDAKEYVFAADAEEFWSVVPGKPDDSELVIRVGLPQDDDDFMPQKGEALNKAEVELLSRWVAEGAEWPAAGDEWIAAELAARVLPKITFELPPLDQAQREAIAAARAKLLEMGAVVQTVAADTEALDVNLSLLRDKITDAEVFALVPLAPVLVWLNVSRTAISDAGAVALARLTQLRRLNVANTRLTDAAFARFATLTHLEYLNAYDTWMGDGSLPTLAALPKLAKVYAWQSKVTAGGVKAIRDHFAKVEVDLGDYVEARLAAAQKEIDERENRAAPTNDKCPVSGEPIDRSKTVEHEGRVVAFCCDKCKAKFEADPAAFADKLPAAPGAAPKPEAAKDEAKEGAKPAAKPINEQCPVSGEPVDPAQTVVHDGRVIAFCCGKCKAKFVADPTKFAGKLPAKK